MIKITSQSQNVISVCPELTEVDLSYLCGGASRPLDKTIPPVVKRTAKVIKEDSNISSLKNT